LRIISGEAPSRSTEHREVISMRVQYVMAVSFGVVVDLLLLVYFLLTVRGYRAGRRPPSIAVFGRMAIVPAILFVLYLALRRDRPTLDMVVTELLIMLGMMFVVGMLTMVPVAMVAHRFMPSMTDEERERALERDQEEVDRYIENATKCLLLWHVPTLIVGATVLAAFGAVLLARALVR
jgi:hypothetical protein